MIISSVFDLGSRSFRNKKKDSQATLYGATSRPVLHGGCFYRHATLFSPVV